MENVVSLSVENTVTIFLMCLIGWMVATLAIGFIENRSK